MNDVSYETALGIDLPEAPLFTGTAAEHPLCARIVTAMRTVFDPEIPVNIYDLGLIYHIDIAADGSLDVQMTLTAPGCPVAGEMPGMVQRALETEVPAARVVLVWEPPWTQERMSEIARLELGFL